MAEKQNPISVEARRLDISILPDSFSFPLSDFLVSQNDDLVNVAGYANTTANIAYLAQVKNEEQDVELKSHGDTLADHEIRIGASESKIQEHEVRISDIETDYVSKSETSPQSLAGPLNVTTSYSIGGVKVVGPRQVGWSAAGGNVAANIGAWNPNTLAPASSTYVQAEAAAVRQQLNAAEARVKALESALRTHGLIS